MLFVSFLDPTLTLDTKNTSFCFPVHILYLTSLSGSCFLAYIFFLSIWKFNSMLTLDLTSTLDTK